MKAYKTCYLYDSQGRHLEIRLPVAVSKAANKVALLFI